MSHWARISRYACALVLAGGSFAAEDIAPALNRYCVGCHNGQVKAGGFVLNPKTTIDQEPETWEKVVRKLRARYMPPAGLPRPDERTYEAIVSTLSAGLDSTAAAHP